MPKDLFQMQGFEQLQAKIKKLPDKVKKKEMLKVLGQVANPTKDAAKRYAPFKSGTLKDSIGKIKGKKGLGKENAVLYVGPRSKGKWKGWYGHIIEYGHNSIYRKGFKRNRKGNVKYNSTGSQRFVKANPFMKKAFEQTKGKVTADAEKRVARYIQKQINKL